MLGYWPHKVLWKVRNNIIKSNTNQVIIILVGHEQYDNSKLVTHIISCIYFFLLLILTIFLISLSQIIVHALHL